MAIENAMKMRTKENTKRKFLLAYYARLDGKHTHDFNFSLCPHKLKSFDCISRGLYTCDKTYTRERVFLLFFRWLSRTDGIFMLNDNRRYRGKPCAKWDEEKLYPCCLLVSLLMLLNVKRFFFLNHWLRNDGAASCVWIMDVNISLHVRMLLKPKPKSASLFCCCRN